MRQALARRRPDTDARPRRFDVPRAAAMTDPRQLLDDYAAEKDFEPPMAFKPARTLYAPKAFVALRAVLDRHPLVHDDGDRCGGCWNWLYETYERWPCPTVQAITTALEAK